MKIICKNIFQNSIRRMSTTCAYDWQCAPNWICVDGTCGNCRVDKDCSNRDSTYICNNNHICERNCAWGNPCKANYYCVDRTCTPNCLLTGCQLGYQCTGVYCEKLTCVYTGCPTGMYCDGTSCKTMELTCKTTGCPPNFECRNDVCVSVTTSKPDENNNDANLGLGLILACSISGVIIILLLLYIIIQKYRNKKATKIPLQETELLSADFEITKNLK
jgi:hypothetical protein